jgi:four helix bundle protein
MSEPSPIFVKTETLIVWLLPHTQKFPKAERFRLAKRIDDTIFAFHESLIYATKSKDRRYYLTRGDAELDKLRTYLRLALELKYITPQQFHYAAQQMLEIGKLLGGWIKSRSA